MADLHFNNAPRGQTRNAISGDKTGAPASDSSDLDTQGSTLHATNSSTSRQGQGQTNPRPQTSHLSTHTDDSRQGRRSLTQNTIIGFDNSDRNQARRSLDSCTDRVAEERRKFGPWQAPNPEKQRQLTDRLAPHKLPAPPDPKFDTWVNHFKYYWNIGVDVKSPRSRARFGEGFSQETPGTSRRSQQRILQRPRTTPGRLSGQHSEGEHDMSGSSRGSAPIYRRATVSAYPRGSSSSGTDSENGRVVSGLDRRYMGLQSVTGDQLKDIVSRLTRMTSAYQAKFAPNPHVWMDTSPGAHMVNRRENTIA